ncbi:MAG: hypothetical protein H0U70_09735 [Tatlockia sp.]|nr:hypothetical protein [Tatlockia sp.]
MTNKKQPNSLSSDKKIWLSAKEIKEQVALIRESNPENDEAGSNTLNSKNF